MKNLATLKKLNNQVVIAMQAARLAAFEVLKELAVEVPVRSDEDMQAEDCEDYDETERKGLYVYGPGKYYSLSEFRIDAVKAGEKGILCHYCEWNEHEADDWAELEWFYDCENILECIQWPDEVPDGEAEQEAVMVLCSYDEDDDVKDMLLAIQPDDIKKPETIDRINKELRRIFCVDDYVSTVGDEGEQEYQEAIDCLANGHQATFECYKWWWEKVEII